MFIQLTHICCFYRYIVATTNYPPPAPGPDGSKWAIFYPIQRSMNDGFWQPVPTLVSHGTESSLSTLPPTITSGISRAVAMFMSRQTLKSASPTGKPSLGLQLQHARSFFAMVCLQPQSVNIILITLPFRGPSGHPKSTAHGARPGRKRAQPGKYSRIDELFYRDAMSCLRRCPGLCSSLQFRSGIPRSFSLSGFCHFLVYVMLALCHYPPLRSSAYKLGHDLLGLG